MADWLNVSVLAVLQGVAEFLPVSSSGHLVIGQHLLGMDIPGKRLDVFLHLGTLLSIFAFYARPIGGLVSGLLALSPGGADRRRESWSYALKLLLSALPAVAVYFPFHEFIDGMFENARMVGALLMFTGAVLIGTRFMPAGAGEVTFGRALLMGLGQALALLPGVSRSGMTLASARSGGVAPAKSAEFSFLMSAPLIMGAVLLETVDDLMADVDSELLGAADGLSWGLTIFGCLLAAVVGYLSLKLLVRILEGRWFWLFGPYCLLAGLLTLIMV